MAKPSPMRAFRDMWVAGTLGAYFTALARNVPLHIQEIYFPPDWPYTFDVAIRYGYSIWFLAYFFVSHFDNAPDDVPKKRDISFDIIQSSFALWAIFWIGFALPGRGYGHDEIGAMLMTINTSIAVICVFSLLFFGKESKWKKNTARVGALLVSAAVMALLCLIPQVEPLTIGGVALIIHISILVWYIPNRK